MIAHWMTCLHFLVGSFKILKAMDECVYSKSEIIDWVYSNQICGPEYWGFRGGPFLGFKEPGHSEDVPHIANTYCAVCILIMLDDDLSWLQGGKILETLNIYQQPTNGTHQCPIRALPYVSEEDMRFVYCACALKHMLEQRFPESVCSLNTLEIEIYISQCQTYDLGFSWIPYGESHSGLSYCAFASMKLINSGFTMPNDYVHTLISKQCSGF